MSNQLAIAAVTATLRMLPIVLPLRRAARPEMFTIRPQPWARMCGATACALGPGAKAGHLVFVRGGALMAAPFDPDGSSPAGPAIAVIEGVRPGQFDVSESGLVAYVPGAHAPTS